MHATDTGEGHPESAAAKQEAVMVPNPSTFITLADLHRQDLLATAERERRAATVAAPAPSWRALAIRVVAFVVLFLGVHR
jgi:hypothetical protein